MQAQTLAYIRPSIGQLRPLSGLVTVTTLAAKPEQWAIDGQLSINKATERGDWGQPRCNSVGKTAIVVSNTGIIAKLVGYSGIKQSRGG